MFKYFTNKGTRNWTNILSSIIESYNNTPHRAIGLPPSQVSKENEKSIFERLYGFPDERSLRKSIIKAKIKRPKFQINDIVRIRYYLPVFEHRFYPNYSDRLYRVAEVVKGHPRVKYKVKNFEDGKLVPGTFYDEELLSVKEGLYRIEKILQRKGKKVLVKWVGYPDEYNEWISKDAMQTLG